MELDLTFRAASRGRSPAWREDVADFARGAVCWVELSAAFEEFGKIGLECVELTAPFSDFSEFGFEE